jgi:hypothetical protein
MSAVVALKPCPTCKGTGTYNMPVTTFSPSGRTDKIVPMGCTLCDGSGKVTPATLRSLKREAARWCRCEVECDYPTVHMKPNGCIDWVECTTCHTCMQVG